MGLRSAFPDYDPIRDNQHFTLAPGRTLREGVLPGRYRELMIQNGTLLPDGRVNEETAVRQGYRREGTQWVGSPQAGRTGVQQIAKSHGKLRPR